LLILHVHVERIKHGKLLAERIGCPFLCGKDSTEKRQKILNDFKEGKIRVLVSTLLGEGVNIENLSCLILAHGLKSSTMFIQRVGRALRPGKSGEAIIVDFADKGPFLAKHFEQRYVAAREYYGKYFKPEFRR